MPSAKAAERGEPSYVWRAGQERRLRMIAEAANSLPEARVLDNGCGLGAYVEHIAPLCREAWGIDFEHERVVEAARRLGSNRGLLCAAGEALPFADASFDLVISNEVIEHVQDDRAACAEMARVTAEGGRIVVFCPNRWYPVEQHGVYWRGTYRFGNKPLVNYLPDPLRNRLAPHVRTYTKRRLLGLWDGLPVEVIAHARVYGGYDNIAARFGRPGRLLRDALQAAEGTPFDVAGLSHLLVLRRV